MLVLFQGPFLQPLMAFGMYFELGLKLYPHFWNKESLYMFQVLLCLRVFFGHFEAFKPPVLHLGWGSGLKTFLTNPQSKSKSDLGFP